MSPSMSRKVVPALLLGGVLVGLFGLSDGVPSVDSAEAPTPPIPHPPAGGILVVDLVDGASVADLAVVEGLLHADLDWVSPLSEDEALAEGRVADLDAALRALAGNPLVEAAEPEVMLSATGLDEIGGWPGGAPNDPLYGKQWHLGAMGAEAGWADSPRGRGVIVAVVDTGVAKVEDLQGTRILDGASFVPGTKTANDDQGHGTHVAGTIAQTTNNGVGCAGVAPEATILPVKVLSASGMGSSAWIASGIDYAVDQGADVINLSLGGGYSSVIHNAIKKARSHGVLVVAAAGNSGRRGVSWPGALKEAIGVSATGPDGVLAPYSSYGEGVDIAGPGGNKNLPGGGVWQDTIDGKGGHHYAEYQGTSMATPHVAGAAAVLLSTGMTPDDVEDALLGTAAGDGKWNEKYGYGKLDLKAALGHAGSGSRPGGAKFALGAVFALLLAQLAAVKPSFQLRSALFAGWIAGGLFFLRWLPLPSATWVHLLAHPLLSWPTFLFGPEVGAFPLWLSAGLPAAVGFTLGAWRPTRWAAFGLAAGVGAYLLHGAATGSLSPTWIPASLAAAWLVGNGAVALAVALGLAGAEKLEEGR